MITALGIVGGLAMAFGLAVLVGKSIKMADPAPSAVDAPDGTAGDLLADQPPEILLTDWDARFVRLVAPLEAERDRRLS